MATPAPLYILTFQLHLSWLITWFLVLFRFLRERLGMWLCCSFYCYSRPQQRSPLSLWVRCCTCSAGWWREMEQSCGPWQLDSPLKLRQGAVSIVGFAGQQAPWLGMYSSARKKKPGPLSKPFEVSILKVYPINSLHSKATLCSCRETEIPKYIESIFIFPFSPHFIQSLDIAGHQGMTCRIPFLYQWISAEMAVSRVGTEPHVIHMFPSSQSSGQLYRHIVT